MTCLCSEMIGRAVKGRVFVAFENRQLLLMRYKFKVPSSVKGRQSSVFYESFNNQLGMAAGEWLVSKQKIRTLSFEQNSWFAESAFHFSAARMNKNRVPFGCNNKKAFMSFFICVEGLKLSFSDNSFNICL